MFEPIQKQLNGQQFPLLPMTITLKQFGQFILDFVNKNFVPLLRGSVPEHQKCLEQWRQVSELIRDIQKVHIWNLESCLKGGGGSNLSQDGKEAKQYKKAENIRPSASNFSSYENFLDKKDQPRTAFAFQEDLKVTSSLKTNGKEHSESRNKSFKYSASNDDFETKLSLEAKPSLKQKTEVDESESFDKLIQSFRKLCQNFENNHKKLLKEDHGLKENLKVEVTHY